VSDFYAGWETVRARKAHTCSTCRRRIDAGERYEVGRSLVDGTWHTYRQCAHCSAVWSLYRPEDDEGCVSPWGYDNWCGWGARDVTELRHMAQWRRGWRRNDGVLYPFPTRAVVAGWAA
jgi:hypothetical protein